MKDKITLERINLLHPKVREEVGRAYEEICNALTGRAICRFSYTLRTFAEQDALFAQGRTKPGRVVTKAKAGQSYHNYGLALDIVLLVDRDNNGTFETAVWDTVKDFDGDAVADWMEIVRIFRRYGWTWGGEWNFKDNPHFEKTFGHKWQDLLKLHQAGRVDKNGFVLI